jgi:hypothetical protein
MFWMNRIVALILLPVLLLDPAWASLVSSRPGTPPISATQFQQETLLFRQAVGWRSPRFNKTVSVAAVGSILGDRPFYEWSKHSHRRFIEELLFALTFSSILTLIFSFGAASGFPLSEWILSRVLAPLDVFLVFALFLAGMDIQEADRIAAHTGKNGRTTWRNLITKTPFASAEEIVDFMVPREVHTRLERGMAKIKGKLLVRIAWEEMSHHRGESSERIAKLEAIYEGVVWSLGHRHLPFLDWRNEVVALVALTMTPPVEVLPADAPDPGHPGPSQRLLLLRAA